MCFYIYPVMSGWVEYGEGKKGGSSKWSRGHGGEGVRVGKLVCLWFLPHLLWLP